MSGHRADLQSHTPGFLIRPMELMRRGGGLPGMVRLPLCLMLLLRFYRADLPVLVTTGWVASNSALPFVTAGAP
jgi:hypothetical protein